MSRRIKLGKLRNPTSNILSREYNDDEERVKMLMTSKAGSRVIPDIVPESRESYDHRIAFQRENRELLKRANLECYYIDYLLRELESDVRPSLFRSSGFVQSTEYYKYFELGKSLLNAINNEDYTDMSNILQEWDAAKRTPFVAQLLANSAYKRSRSNVSVLDYVPVAIPPREIDVAEEYDSNVEELTENMKALNIDEEYTEAGSNIDDLIDDMKALNINATEEPEIESRDESAELDESEAESEPESEAESEPESEAESEAEESGDFERQEEEEERNDIETEGSNEQEHLEREDEIDRYYAEM